MNAVAFSPDGRTLASGLGDGTVVLWTVADPARVTRIATLTRQVGGVSAVSFSPDGQLLASGSDGGTVVLRNLADPAAPVITATLRFTVPSSQFPGPGTKGLRQPNGQWRWRACGDGVTAFRAGNAEHAAVVDRVFD